VRDKRFFSSPKCPDWVWGPPSVIINGYHGFFHGVKAAGREAGHLPPLSAEEVMNDWSNFPQYTFIYHKDNFTFYVLLYFARFLKTGVYFLN
jgi:hypothetical protein